MNYNEEFNKIIDNLNDRKTIFKEWKEWSFIILKIYIDKSIITYVDFLE